MNTRVSLNQTYEMFNWLNSNRQRLGSYLNQYIAYNGKQLIAHGKDLDEVLILAKTTKKPFTIYLVPPQITSREIVPICLRTVNQQKWLPSYLVKLKSKKSVVSANMLVGSGADFTVISLKVGQELGYCLIDQERTLLAQGTDGTRDYVLRNIEMTIDGHTFIAPVVWLQEDAGKDQMLLGKEIVFDRFNEQLQTQAKNQDVTIKSIQEGSSELLKKNNQKIENQGQQLSSNDQPEKSNEQVKSKKKVTSPKLDKFQSLIQLFKSLSSFVWAIVILIVIIPLLGKILIANLSDLTNFQSSHLTNSTLVSKSNPDLSKVDQSIVAAITKAEKSAEAFATEELDKWIEELSPRVDVFLDWYFSYFNQKKIEFSTPFNWLSSAIFHQFNHQKLSPDKAVAKKMTEDFQREFAKRVLVPKNAQIKFEVLTADTINLYVSELGNNITKVQSQYRIPQGKWERYLNDISTTISDTEGNISHLSLKLLAGGGGYLIAKPLIVGFAGKVTSKVSGKFASKAAAKVAAKTGGAVTAELGSSLIDPVVGIGILIWDIWDYSHTVEVERPMLRNNILDYLDNVERSLLKNPENGIMAAIYQLEDGILKSLPSRKREG